MHAFYSHATLLPARARSARAGAGKAPGTRPFRYRIVALCYAFVSCQYRPSPEARRATMQKRRMEDGSTIYFEARGACRSYYLENGVVLAICRGAQVAALAAHIIADGEQTLARYGRCFYLVDAYDSSRMDTEFREAMTAWFLANRERCAVHMLVQSKLLEMAINVATLVVGREVAVVYSDIAAWEARGRGELPNFRRREWVVPDELRGLYPTL
jgi:hypothetical protein